MNFKVISIRDIQLVALGLAIGILTTLLIVSVLSFTRGTDYVPAQYTKGTPSFKDYYSEEELLTQQKNNEKHELEYFLNVRDTFFPAGFVRVMDDGIIVLGDMRDAKYAKRVAEYSCKISRENFPGAGITTVKVFVDNPAIEKPILIYKCFEADVTTTSVK